MAHTIANKEKLLLRVKKIKGQMGAIEKALEAEKECFKVLQQISAARGAIHSLMSEVLDGHIKEHLGNHIDPHEREREIENLAALLKTYLK
ncbi:MAG: metal/formaldehyde-sensitive transcriptional repressor [Sulfuricurvum sp.]|jgi:DNA-binding FrmR family transcriptional regulator|uniref:metal/formaldehyde-sensitive transcriptional repressor n=1 Tax=Sulfuricurvum sp. TaxID=2025608 RepID=UPI0025E585A8|nr:metal/formaldehyde-sensitive transcriptional repressor [Sulfuricurvum sp.]MCI4406664.1 metal/formaldehyde-sensitive transcriptional repressor [Sulfuricurvum sp.]